MGLSPSYDSFQRYYGSEFINYGLLEFCKEEKITFTRSRAYRKNDQAHVEEKNGSIVRRLIGYDRYEGVTAWHKLTELYCIIRLYTNYFQPCLKLTSKGREGAKIIKKYDKAKTPYQRLMNCSVLSEEKKAMLRAEYSLLDPIKLLQEIQQKQEEFWEHAWNKTTNSLGNVTPMTLLKNTSPGTPSHDTKGIEKRDSTTLISLEHYKNIKKPRKSLGPRTWRTRPDPFENVLELLLIQLKINPELTAKELLEKLIHEKPGVYDIKMLRSLQRRVSIWRKEQLQLAKDHQIKLIMGNKMIL